MQPLERYDEVILKSLRRIIRGIEIHSRKLNTKYKITGHQLAALNVLIKEQPLTVKAIAEKISLSSGTVVGILDRLEKKEFIYRERDKIDRRKVNVHIAEKGKDVVKSAPSPFQEAFLEHLNELPDMEKATIAFSFERVAELLEIPDKIPGELEAQLELQSQLIIEES